MNKKAIMVKFLVTVVLAIIIFIPACAFVTKFFFRISAQGEDSFRDLVAEVQDVAEQADGEQRTFVLKMDEGTIVAAFKPGTINIFSLERRGVGFSSDEIAALPEWAKIDHLAESHVVGVTFTLSTPLEQCPEGACLCLCREIERGREDVRFDEIGAFPAPPTNQLMGPVDLTCGDATCQNVAPAEFSSSMGLTRFHNSDPHRIPLRIKKEAGKVIIEELS